MFQDAHHPVLFSTVQIFLAETERWAYGSISRAYGPHSGI